MARSLRIFGIPWALAAALAPCPATLAQQSEPFAGREQVTAVDLVVEVKRTVGPNAGAPLPGGLTPRDFEVRYDDDTLPVVGVETPEKGKGDQTEPWAIVVYFDFGLATHEGVRWAAEELSQRAGELADRGTVEVVVADPARPAPRQLLAPSREPERISEALAVAVQAYRGREILVRLRREYLAELAEPTSVIAPEEVARIALGEEDRIVRDRLDDLLAWLVAEAGETTASPRRALLLVSGGFDLDPAAFYREQLAASTVAPPSLASLALAGAADSLAHTLAAYGWIAVCLGPPEIGEQKWHWRRKLQVRIDRNWDPQKAAAYVQLGLALRDQGKLDDAIEAFEKALYHFYDYPKNRQEQAEVAVFLGETFARAGRGDEAEEAFRQALELDASLAARFPALTARLQDPLAPLGALAESTVGRLVRNSEALAAALTSLDRRVRLTYQVAGPPDGRLHPIEAYLKRFGYRADAPAWARSSTPTTVAALRLRRLLAGDPAGGDLALETRLEPLRAAGSGGDRRAILQVRLPSPPERATDPDRGARFRISTASGAPEGAPAAYHHELLPPETRAGRSAWEYEAEIALPPGQTSVAVVVEDLVSGRWGGGLVDLGAPFFSDRN